MVSAGKKSKIGVKTVINYLEKQGFECEDVSHNTDRLGFDILAKKGRLRNRIEVKCSEKNEGISDCFPSEFTLKKQMVADSLYIVRIHENGEPYLLDILSKLEVDTYAKKHSVVRRVRLASKLKTDLKNRKVGQTIKLA